MRYRKKTPVVEVFRFDGTGQGHEAVDEWARLLIGIGRAKWPPGRSSRTSVFNGDCAGLYVNTRVGNREHASPGDYVVCDAAGSFFVVPCHEFVADYEPAGEPR